MTERSIEEPDLAAVAASEPTAPKPRLRGWLHAGMAPVALVASIVLVVLAPAGYRWAAAVYGASAVLLFSVSATYHRIHWGPRVSRALKRLDHSNIFLIIAGSYTPFAVALLPPDQARTLLLVVWGGALAGVAFRVLWVGAPRWLYTPLYIALGWVAVFYLPAFWEAAGPAVVVLLAAGGLCYSMGGVVYALKRPDPSPDWFGFHEIFHAFTVAGFVLQYVAVSIVLYTA
ncbi:MAG: hemolysin III family protein [Frankiales bacterium]|nr:hemolysin III family protein [Frankiales bacterium]